MRRLTRGTRHDAQLDRPQRRLRLELGAVVRGKTSFAMADANGRTPVRQNIGGPWRPSRS